MLFELPPAIPNPQVGVDISNLPIDKKRSLQMKEVGGAMMPLWPMVRRLTCVTRRGTVIRVVVCVLVT
jgi:hypothetical protein